MTFSGFAALAAKQPLVAHAYQARPLRPEEVEIQISHCGICHSDLHLIDNDWSTSVYPLMPGHEIVGRVMATGRDSTLAVGERVGVGWQRSACFDCEHCRAGNENLCFKQEATCVGHMGGFADRIRIDGRFAFPLPAALDSATAAPLLCAGVTVFAPLRRWGVSAGARVGVMGLGGLGTLALSFLKAFGCETTAFTSSANKREAALEFGATHVASSTDSRELRTLAHRFDFLLSTVPAKLDWISYLETLKPNGVLCLVGAPPGLIQFPAGQLLTRQRAICGSDIGSPSAIREMLSFAAEHHVAAQVETAPLADVNQALQRVRDNTVRYRMVLTN